MIDNIRHKSIRKKTASRIAAIQILYLHQFNDQPLLESISIYELNYKKFLLEKLEIKDLDINLLSDLLKNFDENSGCPVLDNTFGLIIISFKSLALISFV